MKNEGYAMRLPRFALGFFSCMGTGVLLTWSYYRIPLLEQFPQWTTSNLSLIFSAHNIVISIMMAVFGFALKKIPTRLGFAISAGLFLVGLGGFYFLPVDNSGTAFWIAFILYGFIASTGVACGNLLCYAIYPAWYPERAGIASGIMILAFNITPIFTGALANRLLPDIGILGTLAVTGVIVTVCMLLSVPYGVYPGKNDKLPAAPVRPENKSSRDFTTKEMMKSPAFWALFFFHGLLFAANLTLADHAAGIAVYFGVAALLGMLFAPAKGVSCVAVGWLMDKFTTIGAMVILSTLLMISSGVMIVGANQSSAVLVIIGLVMCSLACGGASSIKAVALRFLFGSKNFQQNIGVSYLNIIVSASVAYIASLVIEALSGSYTGVFFMILSMGALALVFTAYLHVYMKKRD